MAHRSSDRPSGVPSLARLRERKGAHAPGVTFARARFAAEFGAYIEIDRRLGRREFDVVVRIAGNAACDQGGGAIGLDLAFERHRRALAFLAVLADEITIRHG